MRTKLLFPVSELSGTDDSVDVNYYSRNGQTFARASAVKVQPYSEKFIADSQIQKYVSQWWKNNATVELKQMYQRIIDNFQTWISDKNITPYEYFMQLNKVMYSGGKGININEPTDYNIFDNTFLSVKYNSALPIKMEFEINGISGVSQQQYIIISSCSGSENHARAFRASERKIIKDSYDQEIIKEYPVPGPSRTIDYVNPEIVFEVGKFYWFEYRLMTLNGLITKRIRQNMQIQNKIA